MEYVAKPEFQEGLTRVARVPTSGVHGKRNWTKLGVLKRHKTSRATFDSHRRLLAGLYVRLEAASHQSRGQAAWVCACREQWCCRCPQTSFPERFLHE